MRQVRGTRRHYIRKPIFKIIGMVILAMIVIISLFYFTPKGREIRRMVAGSILSSQHPQYAKLLLSEKDYNDLLHVIYVPQAINSSIGEHFIDTPVETQVVPVDAPVETSVPKKPVRKELTVEVDTVEDSNYTAKVMKVSDPTTIHVVTTQYKDKGQPLSELIEQNGAIAGINAGGFSDADGVGNGGSVIGVSIGDGKILNPETSSDAKYVVGGFTKEGKFISGNYSKNELLANGVTQAVSFAPQLIIDGNDVVNDDINNAFGWAPRTAIGQGDDGTVIMIVTDGRFYHNKLHRGASMRDLVKLFQKYNVTNAYALDGGGSTTMINDGKLQLKPATDTRVGMRYIPNAFVIIPHKD